MSGAGPRIALATCAALPEGHEDAALTDALAEAGARPSWEVWSDPAVEWEGFDLVLLRSIWDYTQRRDDFGAWTERVGERLRNRPALVRWNSEKGYMRDLAAVGLPVVPTELVEPGCEAPVLEGEVVVKPTISAGARETGRFGPGAHGQARKLIASIQGSGQTAMVQPYQPAVDEQGETAIVFFAGRPSHVLRKEAVLRPDEVAPVREGELLAAEVMWDPELVGRGEASEAEIEVAERILAAVERRFGEVPLYARVDLVAAAGETPVLMELEAVEPNFYFRTAPQAASRLAAAAIAAAG